MKRKAMMLMLLMGSFLILAGCGCDHQWNDTTCEEPKTCSECGETEGEALGHEWKDATCAAPKTCAECGETEGEALGHEWKDATCAAPKTCAECGETEGEALGHEWKDATCAASKTCAECGEAEGETLEHTWAEATTEAPKTCTGCGATEGERIITDPRFTTAAAADLIGNWTGVIPLNDAVELDAALYGELALRLILELGPDGSYYLAVAPGAADEFEKNMLEAMEKYVAVFVRESLGSQVTDSEIDAFIKETSGMSTHQFVQSILDEQDFGSKLNVLDETGVYYVDENQFCSGDDWNDNMSICDYALVNGVLTIDDVELEGTVLEWTRAE